MIVRQLKNSDKDCSKELWQARFNDSEPFVDWFFEHRYRPQFSFGAFEGELLVAVSHGCPMRIMVRDCVTPALMISGVATREGYEEKGLMHRVVEAQMSFATQMGIPIAFNKPVNLDTYASLGFVPCTDVMLFSAESVNAKPCLERPVDLEMMHRMYSRVMSSYSGSVVRSLCEFKLKMDDYLSDGARILFSDDGYCVYFENEDSAFVEEIVALTEHKPLLSAVQKKSMRPIKAKLPPDCGLNGEIKPMCVYALCDSALMKPYSECNDLQVAFGYRAGGEGREKRICFCIDEY